MVSVSELGYLGYLGMDIDAWRSYASDILGVEVVDNEGGSTSATTIRLGASRSGLRVKMMWFFWVLRSKVFKIWKRWLRT
jgi:hypothetical protein